MNKEERLNRRRELTIKKKEQERKNKVVFEYFNIKYPVLYQEAIKFYTCLNEQYPTAKDLVKTAGFTHFKSTTVSTDTMVLKIPLVETAKEADQNQPKEADEKQKQTDQNPQQNANDDDDMIFQDIQMKDFLEETPQRIIDEIMEGLRADPDVETIFTEVLDLSEVAMEIEINDDQRLEDELQA